MSDNFTKLKHHFDAECAQIEQQLHVPKWALQLDGIKAHDLAKAYVIAKLLDDCLISQADRLLNEVKIIINTSQVISADRVQSALSSWTD